MGLVQMCNVIDEAKTASLKAENGKDIDFRIPSNDYSYAVCRSNVTAWNTATLLSGRTRYWACGHAFLSKKRGIHSPTDGPGISRFCSGNDHRGVNSLRPCGRSYLLLVCDGLGGDCSEMIARMPSRFGEGFRRSRKEVKVLGLINLDLTLENILSSE